MGTIHERDVLVGGLLGQGGFCEVRYCAAEKKKEEEEEEEVVKQQKGKNDRNDEEDGGGGGLDDSFHTAASSKIVDNNNNSNPSSSHQSSSSSVTAIQRYAIKYLSPTRTAPHPSDPKNKVFQRGIADLAMEACFLSLLRHDNIITCHFVSEGSLEENFNTTTTTTSSNVNGTKKKKKKKKFKEEIVTDAMGNLVLREVPIPDYENDGGEEEDDDDPEKEQQQQQQQPEVYKHRFGYFLLLDVLHETLAHRIDHVYIPQVLLSTSSLSSSSNNNNNNRSASPSSTSIGSSDFTSSLLHTHEKRDSFLKRIAKKKRSSLLFKHKDSNSGSTASSTLPGSVLSISHTTTTTSNNNNNNNNNNDHDYDLLQQQKSSHHNHLITDQKHKLAQRLTSLLAIGNALQYLHEHHILFRDIKPDNIGFYRDYSSQCTCGLRPARTVDGQDVSMRDCTCFVEIPKLFDFGLAKELKVKYRVEDGHRRLQGKSHDYSENKEYAHRDHHRGLGLSRKFSRGSSSSSNRISDEEMNTVYKLTGCTGSRRYMAPEVCFNDPYNEKADVYSFGMMMYQVASLVTPFDGYSSYDHEKEVLRGGFRPDIDLPTKKDLLICKKIEEELYTSSGSGEEDGGGDDDDDDEEEDERKSSSSSDAAKFLPPPSEKRNEVLGIKSKSVWTKDLKRLIDECWDYDMRYRPPMKDVVVRLQGCIDELTLTPQQLQQQKKGRASPETKHDVTSRGSRNNNTVNTHRQGGNNGGKEGKKKNDTVEGMIIRKVREAGDTAGSVVEVRSNVVSDN